MSDDATAAGDDRLAHADLHPVDLGRPDDFANPEYRLLGIENYCDWLMVRYAESARDWWRARELASESLRLLQKVPPATTVESHQAVADAAKSHENLCEHYYKQLGQVTRAMISAGMGKELDTCKVLTLNPLRLHVQENKIDWDGLKSDLKRIQRAAAEKLEELRADGAKLVQTRASVEPPGALPHSAASNQYLQEIAKRVGSDPTMGALMIRFHIENPSTQGIPTTDAWVNCFREWMTLPAGAGTIDGMRGEMARATLRTQIRQLFPLLPLHYQMLAVKADDSVRIIQETHDPDPEKLALETAKAYGEARWLDDPTIPDPPADSALTKAQAMAAIARLGNWLKTRRVEIERNSTPQQPANQAILPVGQGFPHKLQAIKPDCPFHPLRSAPVVVDDQTADAIRRVITDWEGTNWPAVFQTLRNAGRTPGEIEEVKLKI